MNCRWVFWLDPVFLLLVFGNLVSLNHEIAAGEHIDWVYRAAPRTVVVAATFRVGFGTPGPHFAVCKG